MDWISKDRYTRETTDSVRNEYLSLTRTAKSRGLGSMWDVYRNDLPTTAMADEMHAKKRAPKDGLHVEYGKA
jgi:hypothetical protein